MNDLPMSQLIERFLRRWEQRGLADLTLRHYRNSFRHFGLFLGDGSRSSHDLTTQLVAEFGAWLRTTPLTHPKRGARQRSIISVDKHLADLKQLVRFGQEEGWVGAGVKVRFLPKPKRLIETFSDARLAALWGSPYLADGSELAARNRALVALLVDAGLRLSEAAHLTLQELYL